jgi:hypothetical protein
MLWPYFRIKIRKIASSDMLWSLIEEYSVLATVIGFPLTVAGLIILGLSWSHRIAYVGYIIGALILFIGLVAYGIDLSDRFGLFKRSELEHMTHHICHNQVVEIDNKDFEDCKFENVIVDIDAIDAEAICEAVTRPNMRFVATKTREQQSCLTLHRTRHLLIRQQTSVINAIRAHLAEFAIVAPVGRNGVEQCSGWWLMEVTGDCLRRKTVSAVPADSRLMPKLSSITNPSGASTNNHINGLEKIAWPNWVS